MSTCALEIFKIITVMIICHRTRPFRFKIKLTMSVGQQSINGQSKLQLLTDRIPSVFNFNDSETAFIFEGHFLHEKFEKVLSYASNLLYKEYLTTALDTVLHKWDINNEHDHECLIHFTVCVTNAVCRAVLTLEQVNALSKASAF